MDAADRSRWRGSPVRAHEASSGRGLTVLLVDDDPGVRISMRKLLCSRHYHVLLASDGDEAVKVAAEIEGPLHLLLTDVDMPRMTGVEAARLIREKRPALPVLFMSGRHAAAPGLRAEEAAGAHFIEKPFSADELVDAMQDVFCC